MPEPVKPSPDPAADASSAADSGAEKNAAAPDKAAPPPSAPRPWQETRAKLDSSVPPGPPQPPKKDSNKGAWGSGNGGPPPKKRGAYGVYIWLLGGLAALAVAVVISLDTKPWQQAQETWQEWREDLVSLIPGAQTDPPPAPQTSAPAAPAPATAAADTREAQTPPDDPAREQRLTLLENRLRQLTTASEAALQRLDVLAQQQNELRRHIGGNSPSPHQAHQAALALGLLQLSLAARNSAPFVSEQRLLAALLPGNADIAALAPLAADGVAGETALLLRVSPLLDALADGETLPPPQEATAPHLWEVRSIWQWLKRQACGLVQIRRLDAGGAETGNPSADAFVANGRAGILVRMERAARAGNLRAALAAATRLQGRDAQRAADWMHAAHQRLELQTRIAALVEVVAAATEAESR